MQTIKVVELKEDLRMQCLNGKKLEKPTRCFKSWSLDEIATGGMRKAERKREREREKG